MTGVAMVNLRKQPGLQVSVQSYPFSSAFSYKIWNFLNWNDTAGSSGNGGVDAKQGRIPVG